MTPKQFRKFLDRDSGCLHCGDVETAIPHHRSNRGMGGSKRRDNPANIIVLCSLVNGLLESSPIWAHRGRLHGWKLASWEDPLMVPVFDVQTQAWYLLDDEWGRTRLSVLQDIDLDL